MTKVTLRKVDIGLNDCTEIYSTDDKGAGGANHQYSIIEKGNKIDSSIGAFTYAQINFQKGPVQENGINGCHNEDLIVIVIDRLQSFQNSDYKCRENAIAITKLEEALMWLEKRTANRKARGVEGTSQI